MIRLLLCDDSRDARAALRVMLHEQGEIEIVGEAAPRVRRNRFVMRAAPQRFATAGGRQ